MAVADPVLGVVDENAGLWHGGEGRCTGWESEAGRRCPGSANDRTGKGRVLHRGCQQVRSVRLMGAQGGHGLPFQSETAHHLIEALGVLLHHHQAVATLDDRGAIRRDELTLTVHQDDERASWKVKVHDQLVHRRA